MRNAKHAQFLARLFDGTQPPISPDEITFTSARAAKRSRDVQVVTHAHGQRKPVIRTITVLGKR